MSQDHARGLPELVPAGDQAWLVRFGEAFDLELNAQASAFARDIEGEAIPGVIEVVPTIASVLVRFDPSVVAGQDMHDLIDRRLEAIDNDERSEKSPSCWRLPVVYGGEFGPDLQQAAETLEKTPEALIREHVSQRLRVLMVGFAPGFIYSGLLPEAWDLPRKQEIAPAVPPGSILLAVRQTAITSTLIPTGWYVIGCMPFSNFDPQRDPPVLIKSGDILSFEAIDMSEFQSLNDRISAGETILEPEPRP